MRRLSILALLAVLLSAPAGAGVYYEAVNRVDGQGGEASSWTVRSWVEGANAKIEFTQSGSPIMPAGTYILTNDGGQTLWLVNEQDGSYSELDLEAVMQSAAQLMQSTGGLVDFSIENPSMELLEERDGGDLLGRDTTYYRYRSSYDMQMKVFGMKRAMKSTSDQEIWVIDMPDHVALGAWLRKEPPSIGNEELDALIATEIQKVKGFPLKAVTVSTSESGKRGNPQTTTSTMEVTEMREENIDNSIFVLDPNLVEKPLLTAMPTAQPQEEDEGGLRGLLKRRRGGG